MTPGLSSSPAVVTGYSRLLASRTCRFIVCGLALAIVGLEASQLLLGYHRTGFGGDTRFFLEAASAIAVSGHPRISYWPNSTAGLDLLEWSHLLPSYLSAVPVRLFGLSWPGVIVLQYAELVICLGITAIVLRSLLPAAAACLIFCLSIADPCFNEIVPRASDTRFCLTFSMLAVLLLIRHRQSKMPCRLLLLAGFLSGLCTLSYVSFGIPTTAWLLSLALVEIRAGALDRQRPIAPRLAAFLCGLSAPFLLVGLHLLWSFPSVDLRAFCSILLSYREQAGLRHPVQWRAGLFLSRLVIPIVGSQMIGLLPIALAAGFVNLLHWRTLCDSARSLARATALLVLAWLAFGLLLPAHIMAAQLHYLLPFVAVQIHLALSHPGVTSSGRAFLGVFALCAISGQVIVQYLPPASVGLSLVMLAAKTAYAVMACTLLLWSLRRILSSALLILAPVQRLACASPLPLYLFGLAWIHTTVIWYAGIARDRIAAKQTARVGFSSEQRQQLIAHCHAVARQELADGQWVLTNWPAREIFDQQHRQEIFCYRGLLGGCRATPADKVFLFAPRGQPSVGGFPSVRVGDWIRYRGFLYRLARDHDLPYGYRVLVGAPGSPGPAERPIGVAGDVSGAEVARWLRWRRERSLPIR